MSLPRRRKILITGATGYIGSYTSRILAATHPKATIYALSRGDPETSRTNNPKMAAFDNIQFLQGDCLRDEKLPKDEVLADCDSVIHMVGAISDAFNYKRVLQTFGNPKKF